MVGSNIKLVKVWNKLIHTMTDQQLLIFMLSSLITFTRRLRDTLQDNPDHQCTVRARDLLWRILPWIIGTAVNITVDRPESGHDWKHGFRLDRGLAGSLSNPVYRCKHCGLYNDATTTFCPGSKVDVEHADAVADGLIDYLVDRWVSVDENQTEG